MSSGFGFDIGIEGEESINGLFLALRNLPLHLTDEVHTKALKKAAEPVRFRLIYTTPEDTGLLVSDLRIAKSKYRVAGQHQVIVGFRKKKEGHGYMAHMLEYGTEKMAARPFMRPADEKTKAEQEAIYTAQLQIEVDKRLDGL
jgi:HK97 gp10 family phage protein